MILEYFNGHQVHFACKTGSQLFCTNCKDSDVIVVVDNFDKKKFRIENTDVFVYSLEDFLKLAHVSVGDERDVYSILVPMAQGDNVLFGVSPLTADYDWFAYKDKILNAALAYGEKSSFNEKVKRTAAPDYCLKSTTWLFAIYYAIVNHGFDFTSEQKNILQKCHDGELPRTEAYVLKVKILKLMEGN